MTKLEEPDVKILTVSQPIRDLRHESKRFAKIKKTQIDAIVYITPTTLATKIKGGVFFFNPLMRVFSLGYSKQTKIHKSRKCPAILFLL
jgi:hypothetical protein